MTRGNVAVLVAPVFVGPANVSRALSSNTVVNPPSSSDRYVTNSEGPWVIGLSATTSGKPDLRRPLQRLAHRANQRSRIDVGLLE